MSETIIEDLSAQFKKGLQLETMDEHGSALGKTSYSTIAIVQPFDKPTEDDYAPNIASLTLFEDTSLRRVDSHEGGTDNILSLKSQLARSEEQLQQITSEFQQAKDRNDRLQVQIETYKATTRGAEDALRTGLKKFKEELLRIKHRDSPHEMKLDGRGSRNPDTIRFEKSFYDDWSTEVVLSRTFTFPEKQWRDDDGIEWSYHDDAAVGCLRFDGRLYIAKAGMTRGDVGDFIWSEHWRSKAMFLAEHVGSNMTKDFAIHAEPQLIAFYITRTLQKSGYTLSKFGGKETFPANESQAKLASIVIYVSERICTTCTDFTSKVNEYATGYGYRFELEAVGKYATADEEDDEWEDQEDC
jgi:hypothetical protein